VLENPPLIEHIAEHPVLAGVKLIAEAWDAAGLSQLGKFPAWGRWAELNGVFRDDARRFLRGDAHAIAGIASRVCGSLDIYGDSSRHPYHSVNFITCHDGFTLNDLVSYNGKHNMDNGENNADGIDDNLSSNYGVEGPTTDPEISATRQRQMRNAFVLLLTSQGVPFLLGGDELGRTQHGNNNAFCQDNALSWIDWSLMETNAGLLRFARMMVALRKQRFALSREQFCSRVTWHGERVGRPDWSGESRTLAFHLRGWQEGPDLYVIYNTHWKRRGFQLPPAKGQWKWRRVVDTNLASPNDIVEEEQAVWLNPQREYVCIPRSSVILVADP
jgi:glycogen operon protein